MFHKSDMPLAKFSLSGKLWKRPYNCILNTNFRPELPCFELSQAGNSGLGRKSGMSVQNNYKIWRWSKSQEICIVTLIKVLFRRIVFHSYFNNCFPFSLWRNIHLLVCAWPWHSRELNNKDRLPNRTKEELHFKLGVSIKYWTMNDLLCIRWKKVY